MDQHYPDRETLIARVQQLELEREQLHRDVEQLCMQQAGPAHYGVATRIHVERTAGLEEQIQNLKKELAACTRENRNLQEELSEAYRIKSQLAELHNAEVVKNAEAEKQLKFFQGCVAAAFVERDNAIMESEKAKEREEQLPQELEKSQRRVGELTAELLEGKELVTNLQMDLENHERQIEIFKEVIDRFYDIRQCYLEDFTDASWEEKCDRLMSDPTEMWRFQNDEDTATANYINSLEAEIESLRKNVSNMQNKLRMGLDIETHLKKRVCDLEKKRILTEEKIKGQIAALLQQHSQYRTDIVNLLGEGSSELKSINDSIIEKIRQFELSSESNIKSSQIQDKELPESECRDVHVSADSGQISISETDNPGLPTVSAPDPFDTSEALALALQEKVAALLLLSQQEERHLLEGNVNAALQKKIEELQRNLLQVTNEKVKALMEIAQLKQELYTLQEKINKDRTVHNLSETVDQKTVQQERDGKIRNLLKRTYLTRWVGASDGNNSESYDKPNHQMDYAKMKLENATLKESLESMDHLLSSIRRLRVSLLKVRESAEQTSENSLCFDAIDQIMTEADLVKTALSTSLSVAWSGTIHETSGVAHDAARDKFDVVSAAGLEMVELLMFAAHVLKELISGKN
ncbi:uncharacterized protein LOC127262461 [Andrographis paniculata]|uniref:uncharacterized protein LOC127262461 n=1 Tax=Andrographis paniculata TaxID=175694 RepID=UPI0021E9AC09|nr:uncharacterized protein LOC127262461 [Andrographis paniculata]